jgi:hypothetical protein
VRVRSALIVFLSAALPASASASSHARAESTPVELSRSDVSFTQPEPGATLHGGDLVEIRWSGVPPEADEVELLLSVDGGRHFSLRLTEELDASSRSFRWRVPNLIAEGAALALRMGIGGREVKSAPGPLFSLRPEPSNAKTLLRWRSQEIWVAAQEETVSEPAEGSLPDSCLSDQPEGLTALPREAGTFLPPTPFDPRPALLARNIPARSAGRTAGPSALASLSRLPHSIPQRI